MIGEADPLLRRLQTGALVWCGALVLGTLLLFPDRPAIAGGIAGGGLLTAVSFLAIRSSIDALLALMPPGDAGTDRPRPSPVRLVIRLAGRYALLGVLAYVMIARLRLHPVGLIVGASSLVASATAEAMRGLRRPAR